MTIVMVFEKHTADDCPVNNEKTRKIMLDVVPKLPELLKKHGIKMLGYWSIHSEHLNIGVYDAPNFEAFEKMEMEPALAAWKHHTITEYKFAHTMEETMKIVAQSN